MNNKGFTLVEIIGVLVIISIITTAIFATIHSTLSISKEEAYKVMKNNIIKVSYNYISECNQQQIKCDFSFENNNRFSANLLKSNGYFTDLNSPIDGKDLGNCLWLEATQENGVTLINLIDECY